MLYDLLALKGYGMTVPHTHIHSFSKKILQNTYFIYNIFMANIAFTATTTSQVLPIAGIRAFHITNMGVNPVTLKFSEA